MTPEQIRAVIAARPDLAGVTDSQALADALSAGRKRVVSPTYIGHGTLSDVIGQGMGPVAVRAIRLMAEAALPDGATQQQLVEKAMIEQAWMLLKDGRLDLGLASVRSGFDAMVGKIPGLTEQAVAKLKALAEEDDPVSEWEVRSAIYHPVTGALLI